MKGLLILVSAFLLAFAAVGNSEAYLYTEEYTGSDTLSGFPNQFEFGFDFVDSSNNTTTSSLTLTSDVSGVPSPWDAATVYVDFTNFTEEEQAQVGIWASFGGGNWLNLDNFFGPAGGSYFYVRPLTSGELGQIPGYNSGLGELDLRVQSLRRTFDVTRAAVTVDDPAPPVPEPATMLLLGSGLAGLLAVRRKFKN